MANLGTITNCGLFVGAYDIKGRANAVNATLSRDKLDRSVFGNSCRMYGMGMESIQLSATGFLDQSADIEQTYWGTDTPVTLMIPATGSAAVAAGDRAIFFKAQEAQYSRNAQFGQDAMFNFSATGCNLGYPVGVGWVLNPGLVAVTADNTPAASIKELGAVAAGQYLYAVLHVIEVSTDDSIVVTVQSDALEAFGSPTTQITFASKAAVGAEYAVRVAGPITDTWWRAYADVTGAADVSIKFGCAMAIR